MPFTPLLLGMALPAVGAQPTPPMPGTAGRPQPRPRASAGAASGPAQAPPGSTVLHGTQQFGCCFLLLSGIVFSFFAG